MVTKQLWFAWVVSTTRRLEQVNPEQTPERVCYPTLEAALLAGPDPEIRAAQRVHQQAHPRARP